MLRVCAECGLDESMRLVSFSFAVEYTPVSFRVGVVALAAAAGDRPPRASCKFEFMFLVPSAAGCYILYIYRGSRCTNTALRCSPYGAFYVLLNLLRWE